jgi:hypothetical protein
MGNLSRYVLWDFKRASWQYDVIVALILAFIFLTPREIFRDQPKAANVVMLPDEQGTGLFWIAPQLLTGVPAGERMSKAADMVKAQYKRRVTVTRVEPLKDSEDDVTGYMAYTQP